MLRDLVEKNRSYRGYDESYHFDRKQLEKYIDLTRFTASSVNAQPLKYRIVCDENEVMIVRPLTKWARALPDLDLPHKGKHATAFIVICQDTDISDDLRRYQKDIGIVAQTITLAAVEDGLGGCMIGNFSPKQIASALNINDRFVPVLIVALGKPDEKVVIKEISDGESIKYYRDENDVHYVPKIKLDDIII